MASITTQQPVALWRYTCPECGFGDGDTGHRLPDHALYCEICLEDSRYVKLRRWDEGDTPG